MTGDNNAATLFAPVAVPLIQKAFLTLLEEKHLYQSVEIQMADLSSFIEQLAQKDRESQSRVSITGVRAGMKFPSKEDICNDYWKQAEECLRRVPYLMTQESAPNTQDKLNALHRFNMVFFVPTVKAFCRNPDCGGLWPHNPCPDPSFLIPTSRTGTDLQQVFLLRYQCQNCKKEPVTFLVKRDGLKLTLSGRSPMEEIEIPRYIPKQVGKFYRGAVLAFNCGAYLPAIFMLRTTIEQFMRLAISAGDKKMSGEELTDAYASSLDADFNNRSQSLKPVYATLSDAIHAAKDDNAQLFEAEQRKVLAHFEAKEVFERLAGDR